MQELHPRPHAVDEAFVELASDERPVPTDRPWVMANMIESIDGAYAVDGRSGGLSTAGDRTMFHALRGLADVVLVGAATAREERYRRPSPVAEALETRERRDQRPAARLVLVSRSGRLPEDQPFLSGEGEAPLLVHSGLGEPELPEGVEPLSCGEPGGAGVDLSELLRLLRCDGHRFVLTEGGPGLLGQMHHLDLIDEMFLTVSPTMVGGTSVGLLGRGDAGVRRRHLHRLWLDDQDALFATYRR